MKKMYLVFLILITAFSASAQTSNNEKDAQAVKDLILKHLKNPPADLFNNLPDKEDYNFRNERLSKTSAQEDRKSFFMNGNRISVEIYNYGGIAPGLNAIRGVNNYVWRDNDYLFQFGPIVGASVPVNDNDPTQRVRIISDALMDYTSPQLREVSPDGKLWHWQPLPGYADPDQELMASNPAEDLDGDGKPDSWPRDWYNETLGRYVWPGFLSQDATNADLEVYWAMDDRDNSEFQYYPFINDSSRRGIGLQVDGRALQWSNALAENSIFFVYTITNVSDKDLDSVFFGIYGDPDLGGGSPENTDDNGFFVPPFSNDSVNVDDIPVYARSMVYFWDPDMTGRAGRKLGYLGCKFLESPGNPNNGIDDDGDGMVDESQFDGIDNDGDWNPLTDDLGVDGIQNTGDEGEGDGVPTAGRRLADGSIDPLYPGEPNFELTDLDEADQIGLTSFNSWTWSQDRISNDEAMWNRSIPYNFGDIQQSTDLVFIFASGYISLKRGETKRISMALLNGENLNDLLTSAETVQTIYNQNYQFFKPPVLPTVTAVPGDKKVTLYWDTKAETSIDPITGKDFQGYVIYRSTDPRFTDVQTITDGKGSSFFSQPLTNSEGREAKWDLAVIDEPYTDLNGNGIFDVGEPFEDYDKNGSYSRGIEDPWRGYHPVSYQGRGVQYYIGDNTGLVHSYVDSNNVINGQTYYYAVVAYDRGDSTGIPPTETTKKITVDPITSQYRFDPNTIAVVPGPRSSGYVGPNQSGMNLSHTSGISTGEINISVLNDLAVDDGVNYQIMFDDTMNVNDTSILKKNYSVLRLDPVVESFVVYGTNYTKLSHSHIWNGAEIIVRDINNGNVYAENTDYILDYQGGSIKRTPGSAMQDAGHYEISYNYFPVFQSTSLNSEDNNPVFDGILVEVVDEEELSVDTTKTRWIEGDTNFDIIIKKPSIGPGIRYPADYRITFSSANIDTALTLLSNVLTRIPVNYTVEDVTTNVPQPVLTFLAENTSSRDTAWSPREEIILFKTGSAGLPSETAWGVVLNPPADSSVTPDLPTDGDVLYIGTHRPFNSADEYTFQTESAKFDASKASTNLDNIYVVPNPYVGYSSIEPTTKLPGQTRGERRIYFENLPTKCTIRIFTLSGELVQTINHESTIENGREFWNLLNSDGFGVAYGVYFAHIDAPGVGEKLIKFALIK